ncbi:cardiolipin synthase [Protaetiibacter intestinalis]|uniref:Cardiolipin synthase n=1 Tax=Protaetiibacter intestinalis TaxID=2419774 RepID=A0A387B8L9_9MICO|nr:cardiolipin synthase [Protaetiibacter intestinalis]AYF98108.1 cardiolipin synthase [Protaetiibacter intestinalis]
MDDRLTAWLSLAIVVLLILVDLAVRITALIVVPRNRRPQTAMAWLLAIFFIPYVGILFFLLFGSARLPRGRRRKQREIDEYIVETTEGIELVEKDPAWPPWLEPLVELNRTLGAMPLVGGNSARMWQDNQASFDAMTEEIRQAKRVVHVEFYILSLDDTTRPFFEALAAARARGVKVRVLLDHLGNLQYPGYRRTKRFLDAAGIEWHLMLPLQPLKGKFQRPDLRNHRKLLVIDGTVAFTGSLNVIETPYQRKKNHRRGLHWKDYWVRFEGPVVAGIDAIFVTDWYSETDELLVREAAPIRAGDGHLDCQVVPSGPGFSVENNLRLFNSLVYNAQKRIILVSPYFVPDDSMLYAVTTAAQSGLHVELFVSEMGDQFMVYHAQRSYYEALLKAGVKIYLFPKPTILHAKHMTFDDEVAIIGSSNMDMRSFTLDLEISVMIHGEPFLTQLREVEDSYRAVSRELTLEEWRQRSFGIQTVDNLMRLTAGLQ